MKVAVFLSLGCKNLGDELIAKNEILLLRKHYGVNTIFRVFTYDLEETFLDEFLDFPKKENDEGEAYLQYREYFPLWLRDPKNFKRNAKNFKDYMQTLVWADRVVFGWGGIFFENETGKAKSPLPQWEFRAWGCFFLKKSLEIFRVSIDVKSQKAKKQIQTITSIASKVSVRDESSKKLLQELWIESTQELDPVFYDNGEKWLENFKANFMTQKIPARDFHLGYFHEIDFEGKIVWFALRKWYFQDEENLIKELIYRILKSWGKVVLLPHSFHPHDDHANDEVFLRPFVTKGVSIATSMIETYSHYKEHKIDFCLAMRLHAMILCQVYRIEFIGLPYAQKWELM